MITAILLAAAAPSAALPPRREVLTVFGNDPCPRSEGDVIVVCAREPESERYRIPKKLREAARDKTGAGVSWAARVREADDQTRFTRPDSCSPNGSGGQTGCTMAILRQWFAERRMMQDGASLP